MRSIRVGILLLATAALFFLGGVPRSVHSSQDIREACEAGTLRDIQILAKLWHTRSPCGPVWLCGWRIEHNSGDQPKKAARAKDKGPFILPSDLYKNTPCISIHDAPRTA